MFSLCCILFNFTLTQSLSDTETQSGIILSQKGYDYGQFDLNINPNFSDGIVTIFGLNFHNNLQGSSNYVHLRFDKTTYNNTCIGLEASNGQNQILLPIDLSNTIDQSTGQQVILQGTWNKYSIKISQSKIVILLNDNNQLFDSLDYDTNNTDFSFGDLLNSFQSQKIYPYFGQYQLKSEDSNLIPSLQLYTSFATSFKYQNSVSSLQDNFYLSSANQTQLSTLWMPLTITEEPFQIFFIDQAINQNILGSASNFQASNIMLAQDPILQQTVLVSLLSFNQLPLQGSYYSTSNPVQDQTTFIIDQENGITFNVQVTSISSNGDEIQIDLPLILSNSTYELQLCFDILLQNATLMPQWGIEYYIRQTNYPYQSITQIQGDSIAVNAQPPLSYCPTYQIVTGAPDYIQLQNQLEMNLENYASLIINLTPQATLDIINQQGGNLKGAQFALTSMTLTFYQWDGVTGYPPLPTPPEDSSSSSSSSIKVVSSSSSQGTTIQATNTTTTVQEVTEGWQQKLSNTLIGYSIIIIFVFLGLVATLIFALCDARKLQHILQENQRLEALAQQMSKDIQTDQARLKHNIVVRSKESQQHEEQQVKLQQFVQQKKEEQQKNQANVEKHESNYIIEESPELEDGSQNQVDNSDNKVGRFYGKASSGPSPLQNMQAINSAQYSNFKKSIGKHTEESSIYAHADENTNAAVVITNRLQSNFDLEGQLSDGEDRGGDFRMLQRQIDERHQSPVYQHNQVQQEDDEGDYYEEEEGEEN